MLSLITLLVCIIVIVISNITAFIIINMTIMIIIIACIYYQYKQLKLSNSPLVKVVGVGSATAPPSMTKSITYSVV